MIHCPLCGHALCADDRVEARLDEQITCSECRHVWVVASVHPLTLATPDERQRAETD